MKKLGLYLMAILMLCFSFIFVACAPNDEVTLDKTAITMDVGDSQTLTATTNVESGVTWSTSDEAIATVDGGVVNAIAPGTATITAKAGSASATCTVTVLGYAELTVDKTLVELRNGGSSVTVTASFTVNEKEFPCTFVWASENEEIATVENGSITPVSVGSTVITVSVEYMGETYIADIDVQVKPDEQITISKETIALSLIEINGEIISDTFTATAYKSGVENTDVTFEYASSDESVAVVTVVDGVATVTSVGEGTCLISVSYTGEQGKIESFVEVIVSRSTIVLEEAIEILYVEDGAIVLDVSDLGLQGTFEGVYAMGEQICSADGVLDSSFVAKNKDAFAIVEIHTTLAIYKADLLIASPYVANVQREDENNQRYDWPAYDGSATELGFPAGTETAYKVVVDGAWDSRLIINVAPNKDVIALDVIVTDATSLPSFYVWPGENDGTKGLYDVKAKTVAYSTDADSERKVFLLNADNRQPASLSNGTLYTLYFFLHKGQTHLHFSIPVAGNLYIANIRCINENELPYDPTLPPPTITQGEELKDMPIYDGDVTELGFAANTTVYKIVGPQSNTNDVKLMAQVDASGDNAYAKLDFVLSASTTSLGLWITAEKSHLGYYTITPSGFTADTNGSSSRDIFVAENGERLGTSLFEANVMYSLYVSLDGREKTIQFTTWAALTMYVANYDCITEEELPCDSNIPPVEDGESISILFIGNSFSDDTESYVVDILLELGYTNINVGNLYIGGCSIDTHYENILSDASAYEFRMRSHNGRKYTEYEPVSVGGKQKSISFAIAYKDWDIISVQQASADSGKAASYANLDALVSEVRSQATNPAVEIVFNMTWAYQADSQHANFPDYNSDQMTMYNAIVGAVQEKVDYTVIPNGTAIQNARSSFVGDTLTLDGHHLSLKLGRFIAGLTFVAKVTSADISEFAYAPKGVSSAELAVAIESVQNALKTPFAVTQSKITDESKAEKIYQGIDNSKKLPVYTGDVTAIGFEEGEYVQEMYTIENNNPWGADANGQTRENLSARVPMNKDKEWVTVKFALSADFSSGNLFFAWGTNYDGSAAAFTYITVNGASEGSFVVKILDLEGNPVTELKANTAYLLVMSKPGTNVFKLASMVKAESSVYFSATSLTYSDDEPYYVETPAIVGANPSALTVYDGDETTLGFEEGTTVYQLTSGKDAAWDDRIKIAADPAYKYLDVQFIVAEGAWYFNLWVVNANGMLDGSYLVAELAGGTQHATFGEGFAKHTPNNGGSGGNTKVQVLDENGNVVIGNRTNGTIYTLRVWLEEENVTEVQIGQSNVTMYLANVESTDKEFTPSNPNPNPNPTPDDSDLIVAGGSNANAVSKYTGDVTALGFAEGSKVYQFVGETDSDRVEVKVDSVNYDYVDVQFVITSGNTYFFLFGMSGGSYYNGGVSYIMDTAWPRMANGSDFDRIIKVLDENGNEVTSTMEIGTLYTLRVYTKLGELDAIRIAKGGSTICLANVTYGLASEAHGSVTLPNYTGDATAHGFEEGEFLQYMVTETLTGGWWEQTSVDSNGKTREQLAAKIPGEVGKYVTIKFATSEDIASGSVFYVWGLLGNSHTVNDHVNFTTTTYGRILDVDGNVVTSISKNTVYILELYMEGTDTYKVANICTTGMELYFAPDSITYSDEPMKAKVPEPNKEVTAAGANANAVTVYDGDETALGFAEGTTVYQYVGETSNDKLGVKVDSVNYDYVDIQIVFDEASEKTWFLGFVMNGTSYLNGADAYVLAGDQIRFNANPSNPLDRTIQFLDADGNVVNSGLQKGVVYTLRVYIEGVTEIQMRQVGVTAYLANVTHGVVDSNN